ncbi:hypothetical protein XELAEV_18036494mg [Xenopus laevis]|uniref:Uncharacterized protein n=1 Tax=Xenopus laevis TaxID=8355 RepID=A0A974HD30_XENLA|nr:hypothetical protein XELAEV_18036494mg [Xenopus laevis]
MTNILLNVSVKHFDEDIEVDHSESMAKMALVSLTTPNVFSQTVIAIRVGGVTHDGNLSCLTHISPVINMVSLMRKCRSNVIGHRREGL